MSQQIIDNVGGDADNAFVFTGKINANFSELYGGVVASGGIPCINVKSAPYNAAGNDSTDDAAAIQAAMNAAYTAGGGIVVFPPAAYRINSTLERPVGVYLLGLRRAGTGQGARLSWRGAANGLMMRTDTSGTSSPTNPGGGAAIVGTVTQDLYFHGNDIAGCCYRLAAGNIDQGTTFVRCQFQRITGNCMEFLTGVTNCHITDCRWDTHVGFAIYWDGTDSFILTVDGGCTWDGAHSGSLESTGGFMHLNAAAGSAANRAYVRINDFHPEINGGLITHASAAATDPEKRGLIRLSPNPASYGQFIVSLTNVTMSVATATDSFSVVYFDGGTTAQHEASAKLNFRNIDGLTRWASNAKWNKLIGGIPTGAMWPHEGNASTNLVRQCAEYLFSPGATAAFIPNDLRANHGYYNHTSGRVTYGMP